MAKHFKESPDSGNTARTPRRRDWDAEAAGGGTAVWTGGWRQWL